MIRIITFFLVLIYNSNLLCWCVGEISKENPYKWPTVGISVLVRNKAHTLPYFFSCINQLEYPKDRVYIWIYSDFNEDDSDQVIQKWADAYSSQYHSVHITSNISSGPLHADEMKPTHWSEDHFKHVINLREMALNFGRKMWADYLFMIDADTFLTNPNTLKLLISKELQIVAPMLVSDGLYSNFWCGMTDNYYYKRTEDYKLILDRENKGCHIVPMVHSAVLISLKMKNSDVLTYDSEKANNYDGPVDDIIAFAINAKNNDIPLHVCNEHPYGFVTVPLEENSDLKNDNEQLLNIKLEAIGRTTPLPLEDLYKEFVEYPELWKYSNSEIYLINLERRTERRELMEMAFKELGMDYKLIPAVDGRKLDMNDLSSYSVTMMPNYEDPYHKRPMKAGEVGCFLSHYYIWQEVIEKNHEMVLVLEDDIHFVPYFRHRYLQFLEEIKDLNWDLAYIGRKILLDGSEEFATEHATRPRYSYWTLGYLLRQSGARKLLAARPLNTLLPVDEFLPIMFDQHPNDTWKSYFPKRDLVALSAAPLLVHPTHYTGQPGYVSDTEDSAVITPTVERNEL